MAPVKAAGCSTLEMWPAPSSSTRVAPLDRLLDLADAGQRRILGADDEERAPVDAGEPGPQIVVRQRLRAARKARNRRAADHLAHLVEHRRLGGDEIGREPARRWSARPGPPCPSLAAISMRSCHCCAQAGVEAGPQSQAMMRSNRCGWRCARNRAVMPPMDRPAKCARLIDSASSSASTSATRRSKL